MTKESKGVFGSDPTLQPISKVTMIANEQKRQAFEGNNLKVSGQNLDDHTGFAGAGQFTGWNDDACAMSDLLQPSSENENLWVISRRIVRQALAASESARRRLVVFGVDLEFSGTV
jgi:hypothetical protein